MQDREHHRRQHFIADAEGDIAAAVVFDNLRIHVLAAEIRRGINVGNKTDGRDFACDVGRQRPHHRALFT